jgi:hypothetical protein
MPKFLTTSGTSYYIEKIIINATKNLILISPYLFLSKTLLERLTDADKKGVNIIIVYSQNKLRIAETKVLEAFKNLRIRYSQNLHAKCYFNQDEMIITSMNMYEFSEKNNREMGILIDAKEDKDLFREASLEAKSIFDAALSCDVTGQVIETKAPINPEIAIPPVTTETINLNSSHMLEKKGFCIRCRSDIDYNVFRPFCRKCYAAWRKSKGKKNHEEKYCHQCGLDAQTSLAIPRCSTCFNSKLE